MSDPSLVASHQSRSAQAHSNIPAHGQQNQDPRGRWVSKDASFGISLLI